MYISKMTALGWLVVAPMLAAVPAAMAVDNPDSTVPPAQAVDPGSQVQGKGGGMGKSYQENVSGPGRGYPESRGAVPAAGQASTDPGTPGTSMPGVTPSEPAAEQQPLSRKARDGSGYGSGYPGERGMGVEGSPHHRQYGSQKPATAAPEDAKP
jgi:hypothetical protein